MLEGRKEGIMLHNKKERGNKVTARMKGGKNDTDRIGRKENWYRQKEKRKECYKQDWKKERSILTG